MHPWAALWQMKAPRIRKPKAEWGVVTTAVEGKADKYFLRENGTAVAYTICCDCGLVHLEEYKPMGKYIRVRVWREEDKTKEQRKRKKVK